MNEMNIGATFREMIPYSIPTCIWIGWAHLSGRSPRESVLPLFAGLIPIIMDRIKVTARKIFILSATKITSRFLQKNPFAGRGTFRPNQGTASESLAELEGGME
jgi:hypothetical protein